MVVSWPGHIRPLPPTARRCRVEASPHSVPRVRTGVKGKSGGFPLSA